LAGASSERGSPSTDGERARPHGIGRGSKPGSPPKGAERTPLSLIPIRLALPMTALRDGAPSAAAIQAALLPSSASFLRVSTVC